MDQLPIHDTVFLLAALIALLAISCFYALHRREVANSQKSQYRIVCDPRSMLDRVYQVDQHDPDRELYLVHEPDKPDAKKFVSVKGLALKKAEVGRFIIFTRRKEDGKIVGSVMPEPSQGYRFLDVKRNHEQEVFVKNCRRVTPERLRQGNSDAHEELYHSIFSRLFPAEC